MCGNRLIVSSVFAFVFVSVSVCPFLAAMSFAGYFLVRFFLSVFPGFFFLRIFSRYDLVWFRPSSDHGWIRSGSVNVR